MNNVMTMYKVFFQYYNNGDRLTHMTYSRHQQLVIFSSPLCRRFLLRRTLIASGANELYHFAKEAYALHIHTQTQVIHCH